MSDADVRPNSLVRCICVDIHDFGETRAHTNFGWPRVAVALLLALSAGGCDKTQRSLDTDASGVSDDDAGTASDDETAGSEDLSTGDGDGDAACEEPLPSGDPAGATCSENRYCASGQCLNFDDFPASLDAHCVAAPADCGARLSGRALEMRGTDLPAAVGLTVRIVGLSDVLENGLGATDLASGLSGSGGGDSRFDFSGGLRFDDPLGIAALVEGDGGVPAITLLARPDTNGEYGPMNDIRNAFALPQEMLTAWNSEMTDDPDLAGLLPMGLAGGVVVVPRDETSGDVENDVALVSTLGNSSSARARYFDGNQNVRMTPLVNQGGYAVLLDTAPGESFDIYLSAGQNGANTGPVWSIEGMVFFTAPALN